MNYLKKELYELIKKDSVIFDFIQEFALDGLWYWDIENIEEEWMNSKFWTILGYDSDQMPHKAAAWKDIINQDDLILAMEMCQLHFENPAFRYDQIVRYTHKEGHTVWLQSRGMAIRDDNGKPLRMLGAHTDITSLKEKEIELTKVIKITKEQNERLTNFAHIVSHNLRSHSGNIEMLLSIITDEHPELEKNELFLHLNTASDNLKETISQLNEIVSTATVFDKDLQPINLRNAVEKCIANNIYFAKTAETKIFNNVDEDFTIQGLDAYIDSIVLNLITNGIKYGSMGQDSIINISSEKTEKYIILNVSDNGQGIDLKKYGDELFGMYKTFHGNEDAKGIGLFLTKNQVEAIGGKIEVESEVGKGTTFRVFFKHS
ncbi:sensor histidine kinase [Nonlabens antarcticus]|uniref:sensor histidine kinase n=1 Tax=Nonlabens antarcticus TaxID=392714 RepID=UPI0018917AD9|nr:PAS domain-containing sensor histidine kinase [Nonlabens antarcticus]